MLWPAVALVVSQVVHAAVPIDPDKTESESWVGFYAGILLLLLSVAAVVVVYWLAHVYTESQEMLFEGDHRPLHRRTPHAAAKEVSILVGAAPAIAVYLLLYLLGLSSTGAAYWALWFSVAFLSVIGYLGAHRAGIGGWRLVLESAGAASLGVLAVLGKLFLH